MGGVDEVAYQERQQQSKEPGPLVDVLEAEEGLLYQVAPACLSFL